MKPGEDSQAASSWPLTASARPSRMGIIASAVHFRSNTTANTTTTTVKLSDRESSNHRHQQGPPFNFPTLTPIPFSLIPPRSAAGIFRRPEHPWTIAIAAPDLESRLSHATFLGNHSTTAPPLWHGQRAQAACATLLSLSFVAANLVLLS